MENRTPDTRSGMTDAAEARNNTAAGGFTPTNVDCFIARYTAIKHPEADEADRDRGTRQK